MVLTIRASFVLHIVLSISHISIPFLVWETEEVEAMMASFTFELRTYRSPSRILCFSFQLCFHYFHLWPHPNCLWNGTWGLRKCCLLPIFEFWTENSLNRLCSAYVWLSFGRRQTREAQKWWKRSGTLTKYKWLRPFVIQKSDVGLTFSRSRHQFSSKGRRYKQKKW